MTTHHYGQLSNASAGNASRVIAQAPPDLSVSREDSGRVGFEDMGKLSLSTPGARSTKPPAENPGE